MNARVFVVNEPSKDDGSRTMDISPASDHGELVFLCPAGNPPLDLRPMVDQMKNLLKDFSSEDFLLPVGHPMLIAVAGALAARASGGRIKMLLWKGRDSCYRPVVADLGKDEGSDLDAAKAVIEGGKIVIRLPVENLEAVVQSGPHADRIRVIDRQALAKGMCDALNDEAEDGTTAIHGLLDDAIEEAFEQGSEGLEEIKP